MHSGIMGDFKTEFPARGGIQKGLFTFEINPVFIILYPSISPFFSFFVAKNVAFYISDPRDSEESGGHADQRGSVDPH